MAFQLLGMLWQGPRTDEKFESDFSLHPYDFKVGLNQWCFLITHVTVITELTQVRFRPLHLTLTVDLKPSCPYYGVVETSLIH